MGGKGRGTLGDFLGVHTNIPVVCDGARNYQSRHSLSAKLCSFITEGTPCLAPPRNGVYKERVVNFTNTIANHHIEYAQLLDDSNLLTANQVVSFEVYIYSKGKGHHCWVYAHCMY